MENVDSEASDLDGYLPGLERQVTDEAVVHQVVLLYGLLKYLLHNPSGILALVSFWGDVGIFLSEHCAEYSGLVGLGGKEEALLRVFDGAFPQGLIFMGGIHDLHLILDQLAEAEPLFLPPPLPCGSLLHHSIV